MRSLMPCTPWRSTSSTTRKASTIEVFLSTTSRSRSFGMVIRVSTFSLRSSVYCSATSLRRMPSKLNGLVTTADRQGSEVLGDLGDDRCGTRAGATAHAGGDEDHVGVLERLVDLLRVLFGGALSHVRVGAGAQAARHLVADADLVRRVALEERLRVGVHADELDAHHLCADHPVDGVAAAASDADDLDECEVLGVGSKRHVGWSLCTAVWLELFNPRASTGLSDSSEAARAPSALFPQWCSELSTGRRSVVDDRAGLSTIRQASAAAGRSAGEQVPDPLPDA